MVVGGRSGTVGGEMKDRGTIETKFPSNFSQPLYNFRTIVVYL